MKKVLDGNAAGSREEESVELSLPADPAAVRDAREAVRTTLTRWRLHHLVEVCVLAVSELVTNALRYGRAPIGVRLRRADTKVKIEVQDHGGGAASAPVQEPDQLAESGRGLGIVRAVADEVEAETDGVTTVSVSWRAERRERAQQVPHARRREDRAGQ
jgi:anti-sigma regulatory factor (Ser/Thr protein kinase)